MVRFFLIALLVIVGLSAYFANKGPSYKNFDTTEPPLPKGYRYSHFNWDSGYAEIERDTQFIVPPYVKQNLDSITSDAIETYHY